ncbi:sigma-54-dependent transcriptional regulator [Thalassotalea ganghwensis]
MNPKPSILIADDDADVLSALKLALMPSGYHLNTVSSPDEVLRLIERKQFSCILIDLNYSQDTTSGAEGLSLLKRIRLSDPDVPVIAMTGYSSIDIAVEMLKNGANDFIEKPWRNNNLLAKIDQQLAVGEVRRSNAKLSQENALLKKQQEIDVIAQSSKMIQVLEQIRRIAKSDMNVLFTGENGTGKSMLAKYLHQHSPRCEKTFISVNMGAVSEQLFESEMFGHVKGAFTDAKDDRIGRFELAEKGTLFLDEIANIDLKQQAKLLHVLEEKHFERVGSHVTLTADVRLISATNANLGEYVKAQSFRQDLLYRLNTVEIHIPALRERKEDILPLAESFLISFAKKYNLPILSFSTDAKQSLVAYQWPGNIRELSHTIERALFLATGEQITVEDLNIPKVQVSLDMSKQQPTLADIEKQVILERLSQFDKDPLLTAKSLGLSRSAYYRRLDKYHLN